MKARILFTWNNATINPKWCSSQQWEVNTFLKARWSWKLLFLSSKEWWQKNNSEYIQCFLFAFWMFVDHVFAMIDKCLLSAIAASWSFVSIFLAFEAICTNWTPHSFHTCGKEQLLLLNLLANWHPFFDNWKWWCLRFPSFQALGGFPDSQAHNQANNLN